MRRTIRMPTEVKVVTAADLVKEKQFQNQVRQLAHLHKWRFYHTFDSRRSDPGFPDCVMVRGSRIIFAELKREDPTVKVRPDQAIWLDLLAKTGKVEVYVWRPSMLDTSIKRALL